MKEIGTEIRLFTKEPHIPTHKIKFLTDEKDDIKKMYIYINKNLLHDLDTLLIASQIEQGLLNNVGKKVKKANQVYQYLQSKINEYFVTNFEINHLKIHPILQVVKAGAGFIRFDDEIKDEYLLKPKARLQEIIKEENNKKKEVKVNG